MEDSVFQGIVAELQRLTTGVEAIRKLVSENRGSSKAVQNLAKALACLQQANVQISTEQATKPIPAPVAAPVVAPAPEVVPVVEVVPEPAPEPVVPVVEVPDDIVEPKQENRKSRR